VQRALKATWGSVTRGRRATRSATTRAVQRLQRLSWPSARFLLRGNSGYALSWLHWIQRLLRPPPDVPALPAADDRPPPAEGASS